MAMENILLAVVPAALVLAGTMGGRFLEHKLGKGREVRDEKRKYRQNIVAPIREALNEVQASMAFSDYVNTIIKAREDGVHLAPETEEDLEMLEKLQYRREIRAMRKALTELLPIAASITSEEARKAVQQALVISSLTKETRKVLNITDQYIDEKLKVAHQELEDFATIGD